MRTDRVLTKNVGFKVQNHCGDEFAIFHPHVRGRTISREKDLVLPQSQMYWSLQLRRCGTVMAMSH